MSTYLFCGSREWTDVDAIRHKIDALEMGSTVIHGGARGADSIAGRLARVRGLRVIVYYPRWSELGKRAGIVRNHKMLVEGKPVKVYAFIVGESRGTRNTIDTANKLGIDTVVVYGYPLTPREREIRELATEGDQKKKRLSC